MIISERSELIIRDKKAKVYQVGQQRTGARKASRLTGPSAPMSGKRS